MARKARAAAAAREQRLDALALREEQAWQHVDSVMPSSQYGSVHFSTFPYGNVVPLRRDHD